MEDARHRILRFMRTATDDAAGIAHRVRIAIIAIIFVRLVLFAGDEMLAGVFKHWLTTGFLALGVLGSFALTRGARSGMNPEVRLIGSTVLDATIATLVVLPSVLWPRETHLGVLRAPDILIFPMVAAAGGLRMTYRSAFTGAFTACLGLATLVGVDWTLNRDVLRYGFGEVLLVLAVMLGAGLLAMGTVRFVEGLLTQTALRTSEAIRVRQQFGAYMSEGIARIVLDRPGQPEVRRARVVVLFSDLRGFTNYSETLPPDQLVTELNAYIDAVVRPIHDLNGTVDKYIGDSVMAVFGLPNASGQDHRRAILAAQGMQQALDHHNTERQAAGLPVLRQGIGIHAGEVVAGPVGTPERLQFTVLGDTVNVASRLEGQTKETGIDVLISKEVHDRARSEPTGDLPPLPSLVDGPSLALRGRDEPVQTVRFAG